MSDAWKSKIVNKCSVSHRKSAWFSHCSKISIGKPPAANEDRSPLWKLLSLQAKLTWLTDSVWRRCSCKAVCTADRLLLEPSTCSYEEKNRSKRDAFLKFLLVRVVASQPIKVKAMIYNKQECLWKEPSPPPVSQGSPPVLCMCNPSVSCMPGLSSATCLLFPCVNIDMYYF